MKKLTTTFLITLLFLSLVHAVLAEREDDEYEDDNRYQETVPPQPITPEQPQTIPSDNTTPSTSDTPTINKAAPVPTQTKAPARTVESTPKTEAKTIQTQAPSVENIDSDQDGVIDSLDKHPGQDDFAFQITDVNKNGIVDELENLATGIIKISAPTTSATLQNANTRTVNTVPIKPRTKTS